MRVSHLAIACAFILASFQNRVFGEENSSDKISFERSFAELEQKLNTIKRRGQRLSDQGSKEIDDLMAQLNHQHTLLKRELEEKQAEIQHKVNQGKREEKEWSTRVSEAAGELKSGFRKAWSKLNQED